MNNENDSDNYFELRIEINPEISELLSDICFECFDCEGIVSAEEEYKDELVLVSTTAETLKVYIKNIESADIIGQILQEKRQILIENGYSEADLGSWNFKISKVENQDWSKKWKENWDVTHVSDRITIVPKWLEYEPKNKDEVVILMDPSSAFGTGTHPTTQLCMRAIEKGVNKGQKIDKFADIGTGSGILAICGVKFGAKSAYGCDNDESVIEVARENALLNNVEDKCHFECKTADKITEKYDFITANILHNVLAEIMGDLKALMDDNATLVLSGILDEKKQVVLDAIKAHNLTLIEEIHQDIWVGLIVRN